MVPRFAKCRAFATAFSAKLVPRSRSASSGNRSRNWSTGNVSSNGRPVNRSRISRILPSLRVATNNFIAGPSRRPAPQPREQRGRRRAGHERHAHYAPAPPFDLVRPENRGPRIVRSLHEHVGAEALDQRERRLLVEQYDAVDAGEGGEQAGPLRPGHDGAVRPLSQASHRRVAVHTHDERPTLGARRFEQRHVPHVEQVEHAVREHDRTTLPLAPPGRVAGRAHLLAGAHGTESSSRVAPRRSVQCSSGGVTSVVAITTNRMALHRRGRESTPLNPICAQISPTSPRGAIPTTTAGRLNRRHRTAHPLTNFPTTAMARSVPPIASV